MRIAQIELTAGRHTPIPDLENWRSVRVYNISGTDYKIGEYSGTDLSIEDYTGPWPIETEEIEVSTLSWLRDSLGVENEFQARITAQSDSTIKAFLDMLDSRIRINFIASSEFYKTGVLRLETAGVIDAALTDELLGLGGHER